MLPMPVDPCFDELLSDPRNTVRPPPAHVPMEKVRLAANAAMVQGDAPAMAEVRDDVAPGGIGFRLYRPTGAKRLPVILFCHGGGFVWGSIDTHDGLCRRLAAGTGAAVVSVGYRLAPETTFPGPVEDARAVLRALLARTDALDLDGDAVALCGDSAGAAICVSLAKLAAREHLPLRHMALFYPALDPACDSASQHELADGPLLTRAAMQWFWRSYLGDCAADDALLPLAAAYLDALPPTTIATAQYDPLRDEGRALAERLQALGIDTSLTCYPGMIHGFLSVGAASAVIDEALAHVAHRLRVAPMPQSTPDTG